MECQKKLGWAVRAIPHMGHKAESLYRRAVTAKASRESSLKHGAESGFKHGAATSLASPTDRREPLSPALSPTRGGRRASTHRGADSEPSSLHALLQEVRLAPPRLTAHLLRVCTRSPARLTSHAACTQHALRCR